MDADEGARGPVPVRVSWDRDDRHRRLRIVAVAGLVAGALMAVFGLPPIALHSPLRLIGMVCPLCGGTRAVQALMRGDVVTAWHYNPLAFVVVPGALLVLARWGVGLATGRWVNVRVLRPAVFWTLVALLVAVLWTNQASHAAMLRSGDGSFRDQVMGLGLGTAVVGAAAAVLMLVVLPLARRVRSRAAQRPRG
ncbi:DUF2752 domain-containing protein [Actinomadura violacea]|uniref:DUF2752 domain-containing protein n=1 Tax=Actinomadura violacea TaxID=2819934 RepID=A0ABS3RJ89_9ACTN|nr:DUF2752 domain-containing protein [Actinomadura violacea]MBO2456651.1 DUF2752 domain-containing protein [Actinomadura violacea]